jgi:hypothetical protein
VYEQNVTPDSAAVKRAKQKITLITREEYRRRRGIISRMTEWAYLRDEPNHPRPVRKRWYVEHEVDEYLERLAAERDAGGGK